MNEYFGKYSRTGAKLLPFWNAKTFFFHRKIQRKEEKDAQKQQSPIKHIVDIPSSFLPAFSSFPKKKEFMHPETDLRLYKILPADPLPYVAPYKTASSSIQTLHQLRHRAKLFGFYNALYIYNTYIQHNTVMVIILTCLLSSSPDPSEKLYTWKWSE